MNNKTDIDVQYVSPLKKICMTIGELPSSYLETMSYYEMLVWFTEFLKNQVIPTVNNNAEAVEELQSLYEELRTYVNNYFDNLDVQDEINNKLDAMDESGELDTILERVVGKITGNMVYADDFDTLNEAFEEADSPYGVIYLAPHKTYNVSEPIVLHNNVSIYGNNAKINSTVNNDYTIQYINPVSPNNWDLFETYTIENLIFDCNNISLGALLIDRFHYPKVSNIKVTQNNGYAFKIKTVYWGTFENLHIKTCNGGGFQLCGTAIQGPGGYTGSNQNAFINCSILDYNKSSGYYGMQIIERSNTNTFNQITLQNSKTNNNDYGTALYIKNALNNSFYTLFTENQEMDVYMESGDDGTQSTATFYNPYLAIDTPTKCCLYCKDSKANVYNPTYYENTLVDGYNKSMFVSHHTSGHLSYVYIETDKPPADNSQNKLLCYYDGTTYTDYKGVAPTAGQFGMVFSKSAYNHNTLGVVFRSNTNPLWIDNTKVAADSTTQGITVYRWNMFGNQNATYSFQPTLSGNLQQIPSSPVNGLSYFETNNNKLMTYYGGHWYYADGTQYTP